MGHSRDLASLVRHARPWRQAGRNLLVEFLSEQDVEHVARIRFSGNLPALERGEQMREIARGHRVIHPAIERLLVLHPSEHQRASRAQLARRSVDLLRAEYRY